MRLRINLSRCKRRSKKLSPSAKSKAKARRIRNGVSWGLKMHHLKLLFLVVIFASFLYVRQTNAKKYGLRPKCPCNWEKGKPGARRDCACCKFEVETHCGPYFKDRCRPINSTNLDCPGEPLKEFEVWTRTKSGCSCTWKTGNDCACCHDNFFGPFPRKTGLPCPSEKMKDKCVGPHNIHLCETDGKNPSIYLQMQQAQLFKQQGSMIESRSAFKEAPIGGGGGGSQGSADLDEEHVSIYMRSSRTNLNQYAQTTSPKLQELQTFSEKMVKNGVKQPFISFTANQPYEIDLIIENIENELERSSISYNNVESALGGKAAQAGWCQFDQPEPAKRQPVTIPFYTFPETFEDQYGHHICTDPQWKGVSKLGSAVSIIVSADNGPGLKNSYHQKAFKPCIEELAQAGVTILGYIDADIANGKRDIFEVIQDALAWVESYGLRNIGGVFLNQLPGWYGVDGSEVFDVKFVANQVRLVGRKDWRVLVNPAVGVISL